jgi:3-oxoacyl-[acyl-carrier protein] reductase
MIDLTNKHIFIAGGSRGIGAASAKMAASIGAKVSFTYNSSPDAANDIVKEIESAGGKAAAFQCQITDEESVESAVDAAVKAFGPLDGMVVSAGVFEHCPIEDMTLAFWERTQTINMRGTLWSVKAAAKQMRSHGNGGSIVIYTSTAGQSGGGGGASAYCVSKAGQIIFARCMAAELGPDKIRVNSLAPAWTETEMAKKHLDRIGRDKIGENAPLGRVGLPDDIAKSTCYLLSDAAGFVTGTCHTVDGGMGMRG